MCMQLNQEFIAMNDEWWEEDTREIIKHPNYPFSIRVLALLRLLDIERVENAKLIARNKTLELLLDEKKSPSPKEPTLNKWIVDSYETDVKEQHDWTANTHDPKPPQVPW